MTPFSVLLVEDDPITASVLSFLFKQHSFEVTLVQDGQAADEYFEKQPPTSVVLLDILLPYINGTSLLQKIRQTSRWSDCKVIMLSAKDQASDIQHALLLGADGFFTKPFDPHELMATVMQLLQPTSD